MRLDQRTRESYVEAGILVLFMVVLLSVLSPYIRTWVKESIDAKCEDLKTLCEEYDDCGYHRVHVLVCKDRNIVPDREYFIVKDPLR